MENRITDLEVRITHQESSIDELTRTILVQDKVIKQLKQDMEIIQNQMRELSSELSNIAHVSEETPPPHY